jgi:hypothetical protein
MKSLHLSILKLFFLFCTAATLTSCVADSMFIRQENLSELITRMQALEDKLESQASQIAMLADSYEQVPPEIARQRQLLQRSMEQNKLAFESLAESIQKNHEMSLAQFKSLSRKIEPRRQERVQPVLKPFPTHKLLVGEIERVKLIPPEKVFYARIDTGATTSSLDAKEIEIFERNGNRWVRFKVIDPENHTAHIMEEPVVRKASIIQSTTAEADRRPVVKLQLQLGRLTVMDEFTLVDRTHLDYQILIGRNILRDLVVVDVAQKFIAPLPEAENSGNGTR